MSNLNKPTTPAKSMHEPDAIKPGTGSKVEMTPPPVWQGSGTKKSEDVQKPSDKSKSDESTRGGDIAKPMNKPGQSSVKK